MGFQPPTGWKPGGGPERSGPPSLVEHVGAGLTIGLSLGGIISGGLWGWAAGEAQVNIDKSLDVTSFVARRPIEQIIVEMSNLVMLTHVNFDVAPFVIMVAGELVIAAVVVVANSAIEAFVTRRNF